MRPESLQVICARSVAALPESPLPEVCFIGRSNVGKSSLINAITRKKQLARTGKLPGRTRQIFWFAPVDGYALVDLPGYGYAAVPEAVRKAWPPLIRNYLRQRRQLVLACLLIDSRRDLSRLDRDYLTRSGREVMTTLPVLTKSDKLSNVQQRQKTAEITTALHGLPGIHPEPAVTSCLEKNGITALTRLIRQLLDEAGKQRHPHVIGVKPDIQQLPRFNRKNNT